MLTIGESILKHSSFGGVRFHAALSSEPKKPGAWTFLPSDSTLVSPHLHMAGTRINQGYLNGLNMNNKASRSGSEMESLCESVSCVVANSSNFVEADTVSRSYVHVKLFSQKSACMPSNAARCTSPLEEGYPFSDIRGRPSPVIVGARLSKCNSSATLSR